MKIAAVFDIVVCGDHTGIRIRRHLPEYLERFLEENGVSNGRINTVLDWFAQAKLGDYIEVGGVSRFGIMVMGRVRTYKINNRDLTIEYAPLAN